jgi:AAA family ATP:ADP antiporter
MPLGVAVIAKHSSRYLACVLSVAMLINAENRPVWIMAIMLGLFIGANNLIKILRDSLFLGHHAVSELPHLYILVAVTAGAVIALYTRYTENVSIVRLMLWTNAVILGSVVFFWLVLTYNDAGWTHYVFYIWSAMATVIAVAQTWTLANHIFNEEQGKRYFGLIAAGGTIGGLAASFGASWTLSLSAESNHLLWLVGAIYITASVLLLWARRRVHPSAEIARRESSSSGIYKSGISELISDSSYLKTLATLILVSVIVSTLIDFHFKVGAKDANASAHDLAAFFSLYYGWLNVATLFFQVVVTGRLLSRIGIRASLYVTPSVLLSGATAIIIWPGLPASMLTRMGDVVLRNSVHRSGMEMLYMPLPPGVVKAVKTFLDVVIERVGDATAGFIILAVSLISLQHYTAYINFICAGLILTWLGLTRFLQARCLVRLGDRLTVCEPCAAPSWLERD